MAQIDPNIAMGFRPIQIESPINQMAAISQLENARQQQQMNMLQMQEYARKAREDQDLASQRNALAQIHSNLPPGMKIGSQEYLNLVASKAPRFLTDIMDQQTKREGFVAQREEREAKTQEREFQLSQKKDQISREKVNKAIADIAGFDDLASIQSDIERKLTSGELTEEQANKMRAGLPADDSGIPDWQRRTLMSLMDLKERVAAMRDEGKPIVVEGSLVSPTGRVIYQGDKKPVTVPAGSQLVNPNTGEVIFTAKDKPVTVTPGGQLVDPSTGQVIFTAESADAKPVTVAPGGVVVNPKTGEVIYTAPAAPEKPEPRTEAQRNYDAAIADGSFKGTFAAYLDQQKETEAEREYRKAKLPVSQGGSGFTGTFLDFKKLIAKANKIVVQPAPGAKPPDTTLDFLAQQYIQDSSTISAVPKGLRMAVINRAVELTGRSAKDMASDVIANRQDTAATKAAVKDFTSGKAAVATRSFNTAIDHLETMGKLATALQNNDTRVFNSVGNFFAKQTGTAAPANFEAAKSIVGGEIAKALTGANMALADRLEIRDSIIAASSPAQLQGVLNTYKQLLAGQLNSLNIQYQTGTGRNDFRNKLSPASRRELDALNPQAPKPAGTVDKNNKWLK